MTELEQQQVEMRLVELENRAAFQEHLLEQLDHSLTTQQFALQKAMAQIQLLHTRLQALQQDNGTHGDALPEPPPPHY